MSDKILKISLGIFLFLLPLYFLPIGNPIGNMPVETDKQTLLVFFSAVVFILSVLKTASAKKIVLVKTPFNLMVVAIAALSLLSTFLFSPNKIESLMSPMASLTFISVAVLFFALSRIEVSLTPLIISAVIVSFVVPFKSYPGGLLSAFSLTLVATSFLIVKLIANIRKLRSRPVILQVIALLITLSATLFSSFHLLTDQKPVFLPFPFGWAIMMEMYKNFLTFLLGVSPANFSFAYSLAKPTAINLSPLWNATATASSNFPLTLGTETGSIAAIIFLLIIYKTIKLPGGAFQPKSLPFFVALLTAFTLQLLLPTNITLLTLTFIFLSQVAPKIEEKSYKIPSSSSWYIAVMLILAVAAGIFMQGKLYLSDIFYRKAIVSISNGQNLQDAYNQSLTAVSLYPFSDRYFTLSSSLSLELAKSLSQSPNASKSAQQINQLSQQAVSHAQQATNLNPLNGQNWGQLSFVYRSMIGSVQGAEQMALDSLQKQMTLEPNSPQPKLVAGQLLMAGEQLESAGGYFSRAINLKPDWDRARYSMAIYFQKAGRLPDAVAELERTVDLTPADSEDYQRLKNELEQLKSMLPEATASANTNNPAPGPTRRPSPPPQP